MKFVLDIVIVLLVVVLIGAGGFVGYTVYQNQQEDAPITSTGSTTVATPVPSSAENVAATSNTMPACNTEQRQQTIDLILEQNDVLFKDMPWTAGNEDNVETIQDFSKVVLKVDELVTRYQAEYAGRFPNCAAAYAVKHFFSVAYDNMEGFMMLSALSLYVLQNGDEATRSMIIAASDARGNFSDNLPDENVLIAALRDNNLNSDGLAMCSAEEAATEMAMYTPFIEEYQALYPHYLSFMEARRGDFSTLFRFETLSQSVLQIETKCAGNFEREIALIRFFLDTSLAVHLAQLAAFEQLRGDLVTAEALEAIVTERHNQVLNNVGLLSQN